MNTIPPIPKSKHTIAIIPTVLGSMNEKRVFQTINLLIYDSCFDQLHLFIRYSKNYAYINYVLTRILITGI